MINELTQQQLKPVAVLGAGHREPVRCLYWHPQVSPQPPAWPWLGGFISGLLTADLSDYGRRRLSAVLLG